MANNTKEKVSYEFRDLATPRGGRFSSRIQHAKSSDGREFVTIQVSTRMEDRELKQLRDSVERGGSVFVNLNMSLDELKGSRDLLSRIIDLVQQAEARIDSRAMAQL